MISKMHCSHRKFLNFSLVLVMSCCLSVIGFADELQLRGIQTVKARGQNIEVIQAVPALGGYLASVRRYPSTPTELKSFIQQYGSAALYGPAWLSKEFAVINLGDTVPGDDAVFTPVPAGLDKEGANALPPAQFPQVIAVDPTAEVCPYLFGTPIELRCLKPDLTFEKGKTWRIPFQAKGYTSVDGAVFVKGLRGGNLLHRFDLNSGKLVEEIISLKTIRASLEANYNAEELSQLNEGAAQVSDTNKSEVSDASKSSETLQDRNSLSPDEALNSEYQLLLQSPSSFEYDVAISANKAHLLIKRPLALVTVNLLDGKVVGITKIRKEDLPGWAHSFNELTPYSMGVYQGQVVAWFVLSKPLTYAGLISISPERGEKIRRDWEAENSIPLRGDTIIGIDQRLLGLRFLPNSFRGSWSVPLKSNDGEWILNGMRVFHLGNEGIYVSLRNLKTGSTGLSRVQ